MDSQSFDERTEIKSFLEPDEFESPAPQRGSSLLAWCAIIATIGFVAALSSAIHDEPTNESSTILLEIQARYFVGAASVTQMSKNTNEEQIQDLFGHGSIRQRLMGSVMLGELVSPDKATKSLAKIEADFAEDKSHADGTDIQIVHDLQRIQFAIIQKKDLQKSFQEEWLAIQKRLSDKLGWVGKLAVLPPGTSDLGARAGLIEHARRTLFVVVGVVLVAAMAMACGTVLQIVWWVFVLTGRLSSAIGTLRGSGAIYAETFAVWIFLYIGMSIVLKYLPLPNFGMVWVLIPQIGGLSALAWPVFRGIPWRDVREDLGLSFGKTPWTTPFMGIGTYLAALPVVGVAMIITLLMMFFASHFAQPGDASAAPVHPIIEPILRGNWTVRLELVFIAVFAAIPEEIMFRGALYRHLREAGKGFGYVGKVAFATLASSFVFAAIHPQGLFGIPILMSVAIVFAIAREWQGSLVPSIIAHGLVNAGTSMILLLIAD